MSSGSFLGETPALLGIPASETCQAVSFVQALRLPRDLYVDFIARGSMRGEIVESRKTFDFLRGNWLFADGLSCVSLSGLLRVHSNSEMEIA